MANRGLLAKASKGGRESKKKRPQRDPKRIPAKDIVLPKTPGTRKTRIAKPSDR